MPYIWQTGIFLRTPLNTPWKLMSYYPVTLLSWKTLNLFNLKILKLSMLLLCILVKIVVVENKLTVRGMWFSFLLIIYEVLGGWSPKSQCSSHHMQLGSKCGHPAQWQVFLSCLPNREPEDQPPLGWVWLWWILLHPLQGNQHARVHPWNVCTPRHAAWGINRKN